MDNDAARELIGQLMGLATKVDTQNARQDYTNELTRELIEAINTNSQELLELREAMAKKG